VKTKSVSGTFARWPTVPKRARRVQLIKELLSNLELLLVGAVIALRAGRTPPSRA